MVLYQALASKILVPIINAHERRGEKRGFAQGVNAMKLWMARKEAAEAKGEPFDEPQPGS